MESLNYHENFLKTQLNFFNFEKKIVKNEKSPIRNNIFVGFEPKFQ